MWRLQNNTRRFSPHTPSLRGLQPPRGCVSPWGGRRRHLCDYPLGARIAIVMREMQVLSPASLGSSIAQTWVLRPMCTGRVMPVTQPLGAPIDVPFVFQPYGDSLHLVGHLPGPGR